MKKIILILIGISILLVGVIFILYKNNNNKNEEVIDIFKEDETDIVTEEKLEETEVVKDTNTKVIVDIKGMVENPGVYEVEKTKRVNDVILMAGGLKEGADTSLINLAKIVKDEMTIIIYSKEEILEKYKEEICICDCSHITNDACIESQKENNNINDILVNINTGDKEELMKIPGIGESKAESIIEYREKNGLFKTEEDIKNVSGIGETLFEEIKIHITV